MSSALARSIAGAVAAFAAASATSEPADAAGSISEYDEIWGPIVALERNDQGNWPRVTSLEAQSSASFVDDSGKTISVGFGEDNGALKPK